MMSKKFNPRINPYMDPKIRKIAHKRILIITEKSKSEVSYFGKLKEELNLSENDVAIVRSTGSSPRQVVLTARWELERAETNEIGVVFCVFDRDTHSTYREALDEVRKLSRSKKCESVKAVTSVPCFEYWYLLHVQNSRMAFGMDGSPCSKVIKILKGHQEFERYDKSDCSKFFKSIKKQRISAIRNAKSNLKDAQLTGEAKFYEDPSTRVYMVVEAMEELANRIYS